MRKRIKIILFFLVVISLVAIGLTGYVLFSPSVGPTIPKKNIPSNIPEEVREQIERLYSSDPVERADAAFQLGRMGKGAAPAVPFLIGVLKDRHWAVRKFAAEALGEIGFPRALPAVKSLIARLKDKDSWVRWSAAYALKTITGKDFGQDPVKWQKWWEEK